MMMVVMDVLLLVTMLVVVDGVEPVLSPNGVNYEVAALMGVKNRLSDVVGAMDGWDINSVDPCTWSMLACSPQGFVVSLEMANNRLEGTFSPTIANLTHLQTMLLQNNQISGSIPSEIGKLLQLKTLDLSGNQFVGEIPSSLGHLTHLSYLRLNKNNLSGQIPSAVANLAGVSFLDLSFNNLSGPTPKILANQYSVAGNKFLCTNSVIHDCIDIPIPVKETNTAHGQGLSSHHLAVDVAIRKIMRLISAI